MICFIRHVEAMKAQILAQIRVEKGGRGVLASGGVTPKWMCLSTESVAKSSGCSKSCGFWKPRGWKLDFL